MLAAAGLVLLGLVAVAIVALPLLREPSAADALGALTPAQRDRLQLREERDAALAALRELEFDHRTGKISDEDYGTLVGDYRRRVAAALVALDGSAPPAGDAGPDEPVDAPEPTEPSAAAGGATVAVADGRVDAARDAAPG